MKSRKMNKKLSLNKETITNLELGNVNGGAADVQIGIAKTRDYSECGTGHYTLVPCLCPPTYDYSQCGTGPATIVPCMCNTFDDVKEK